ncbi:S8 family serine peptidase [Streptomyces catenulae]|uniref:S8 family serine peptidase n=1 Tax=Streptomyces catenulae TaxID=66875 RepID=A0ABV2Z7B4_9ACTN|nr:S8 family serine peptidase [Streptomyces catenulae]
MDNCPENAARFTTRGRTGKRPPGARRTLTAVAALGLLAAGAAPAAADPGDGGLSLPQIPRVLDGKGCTAPSGKKTPAPPWQQELLRPELAWDLTEGDGTTVAVVDTGVDASAPALAGRVKAGPDVVGGGSAGTDCVGHGTFVAGLIAAAKPADVGFAGVAPSTHVLAVRASSHDGTVTPDHLAAGIDAAVKGGAKVIEVPVALASGSAKLTAAVQAARAEDVLVVAPAYGDQQQDRDAPAPAAYPAQLPGVVAVAALAPPDGLPDQQLPPRTAPVLAAPGDNVLSIGPHGEGHFVGSGADYASAFVAGTAALVRSYRPDLTAEQVTSRLRRTAYDQGAGPLAGSGTVDPGPAVSANLSAARHGAGGDDAMALRLPAAPSRVAAHRAWIIAGASAALLALVGLVAVVVPRGRRRGWRPGRFAVGPTGGAAPGQDPAGTGAAASGV